jgi:hypothetical protein
MWFDNYLLTKGQAFTNLTGVFYNYEDERIPSVYKVFGSSYKQWVSDYSVSGATVPSGVFVNGVFKGRATGASNTTSANILDFDNGRALLSGVLASSTVTGSFAVKDFNIYYTNETEEDLILDRKKSSNESIGTNESFTYVAPYDQMVPAIYINNSSIQNEPFAFGGTNQTNTNINAIVITKDPYNLDGVLSIFADSFNQSIINIPFEESAYTEYGDLKSGFYNYQTLKTKYIDQQKFFVDKVVTSKLNDKERKSLLNDLYVGFIDFDISIIRNSNT